MEWISVKDHPPENEVNVLVTVVGWTGRKFVTQAFYENGTQKEDDSPYDWSNFIDSYDDENEGRYVPKGWYDISWYVEAFERIPDTVIAWAPMPKPAEEV